MGMFDDLEYLAPLPDYPADASRSLFQTKDLDCYLGNYRVDEAGLLWEQTFTVEDRSDPNATGAMSVLGMMTRVPTGWKHLEEFTGEVRFYHSHDEWYEFSAYFLHGEQRELHRLAVSR